MLHYRKVDDGGIFLDEKVVLGEAFVTDDQVRRKFGQFESLQRRIAIRFVLFLRDAVEFRHDGEERDLRNDVFFDVIYRDNENTEAERWK